METSEKAIIFLALVPHRDCLPALEAYRKGLFAAGFDGAYSFPAAAPLALLGRPLDSGELKTAAAELRLLLADRYISSLEQGSCGGWGSLRLFGPMLDLPFPALPGGAVLRRWEKPVLAPALLAPGDNPESLIAVMEDGPRRHIGPRKQSGWYTQPGHKAAHQRCAVSLLIPPFRAAALANLSLKPVPPQTTEGLSSFEKDYSFTWELGRLHWLPRYRGRHG